MTEKFEQMDEDGDVLIGDLSVFDLMYAAKQHDSEHVDMFLLHRSGIGSNIGVTQKMARRLLDDFSAQLRRKYVREQ